MEIPKSSAEIIKELGINGYQFVSLLSKRARELMFGAKPLVEDKSNRFVEIAIKELLAGKTKPQGT